MKITMSLIVSILSIGFAASAKSGIYPTRFAGTPSVLRTENAKSGSEELLYFGGPVVSSPQVVAVYWSSNVNADIQKRMGFFYSAVVDSDHMDWLDQYSTFGTAVDGRSGTQQHIGRGHFQGDFVISPKNSSRNLDDKDVQAEISQQVAAGLLPRSGPDTIYMIHFPVGYRISIEGMNSCVQFCAYHNAGKFNDGSSFYYGVMPDLKGGSCAFGCGSGSNLFDTTTMISAHELVEAITDPFPTPGDKPAYPQAWNNAKGEEIADLCPNSFAPLKTSVGVFKLSQEWDNKTSSCSAGPFQSSK